ncbi:hypothetical protein KOW79_009666 [Hemibagrus wyckioides]|uniref:UPAR/Ly6 domain-containing protein n=1 Tax=Hemibagrus wyckioides TaxID=337641 RepID=A0A9D3NSG0_9TELE|nr:hypothetical protein KOW79_009666 [Hemibagrus wyckioides]
MKLLLVFYFSSSLFGSGRCSTTFSQQCPPDNLCASLIYNYSVPGFKVNMIGEIHGCLPQAVCNQKNSSGLETTYSANVGVAKGFLSISCCESDNCNCIIIPEPDNKPNGLQCLSCKGLTDTTCSSYISCVGNQDHCMTGTVLTLANLTIKGCASKAPLPAASSRSCFGGWQPVDESHWSTAGIVNDPDSAQLSP